jgi:hypothetical protein
LRLWVLLWWLLPSCRHLSWLAKRLVILAAPPWQACQAAAADVNCRKRCSDLGRPGLRRWPRRRHRRRRRRLLRFGQLGLKALDALFCLAPPPPLLEELLAEGHHIFWALPGRLQRRHLRLQLLHLLPQVRRFSLPLCCCSLCGFKALPGLLRRLLRSNQLVCRCCLWAAGRLAGPALLLLQGCQLSLRRCCPSLGVLSVAVQ